MSPNAVIASGLGEGQRRHGHLRVRGLDQAF